MKTKPLAPIPSPIPDDAPILIDAHVSTWNDLGNVASTLRFAVVSNDPTPTLNGLWLQKRPGHWQRVS